MKFSRSLLPLCCLATGIASLGCSGDIPATPSPEAIEQLSQVADSAGIELPLEPAQLAELTATLGELHALVSGLQSTRAEFEGAGSQGRSRLIQRQLRQFLDGLDRPVPFRSNLERVVEVLSESSGDELSDSDKEVLREELGAVRDELGLGDSGDFSNAGIAPMPVGPPGPPGGRPGPPGPRP